MQFSRYHALGNDYLVIRPLEFRGAPTPDAIRRVCHRNFGVGADGVLVGPIESQFCEFGLRIFNPDGSEAEKSGNGLRIFARALWDDGLVKGRQFSVETRGGGVLCEVGADGKSVTVEMGECRFQSAAIPVAGPPREVLNEQLEIEGCVLTFSAATIGNPHCVVMSNHPSPEEARRYGPQIETDSRFPHRTNVQFMRVLDRSNIEIEIWERGAGYTLASGSSGTAAAAVAHRLGLCDASMTVHMPGGKLGIHLHNGFFATLVGPVRKICEGKISQEMWEQTLPE